MLRKPFVVRQAFRFFSFHFLKRPRCRKSPQAVPKSKLSVKPQPVFDLDCNIWGRCAPIEGIEPPSRQVGECAAQPVTDRRTGGEHMIGNAARPARRSANTGRSSPNFGRSLKPIAPLTSKGADPGAPHCPPCSTGKSGLTPRWTHPIYLSRKILSRKMITLKLSLVCRQNLSVRTESNDFRT